ncbi:flagellin [uncultured Cohaesibacter sp.]|uniref:flagellin N-terminal helical domain-containing protein n=1 Tax=uncultured Cohaesibacter sp. TaxID=1002546 RepID=UPI00374976C0
MPVISTNTAANTAVRFLNINADDQSNSLAKLASGSNINKASDDAAGLAIATKISSDVAALEQASTNASHGISVLQTADGGASNIADIVERMKVLASQSASGTVTDTERAYIQAEFEQLQEEIDGICESTRYNGQSLLDGTSDFSVDDTETEAVVTSTNTATTHTSTSAAAFTGLDNSATGSTTTFTMTVDDGTTTATISIDVNANTTMSASDALIEINADLSAAGSTVTADFDDAGNLVFTNSADSAITLGGTDLDDYQLDSGVVTASSDTAAGYENTSATKAESATFTINDIEITVTTDYDEATTTSSLSVDDLITQINDGLHAEGEYTFEASIDDDGLLQITSLETGESASITLADSTEDEGTLDLADFGFAEGTTTGKTVEVASTGAEIIVGSTSADTINLSIDSLTCEALNIDELDVSTEEGAAEALSVLDLAIDQISAARSEMGAIMSRFEFRSAQIDTSVENLEAAESAIRDVDIAKEQAELSASSVKVQAAVAAASQANQMPQNLLSLIS